MYRSGLFLISLELGYLAMDSAPARPRNVVWEAEGFAEMEAPMRLTVRYRILPLRLEDDVVVLAMEDAEAFDVLDEVLRMTQDDNDHRPTTDP